MIADGFSVADKAAKEGNCDSFHLGVRLQPSQPFPFNTMMVHHVNQHHLLPSNGLAVGQGLTGDGIKSVTHDMCRVVGDGAYTASATSAGYDGAVRVRTLQSFEASPAAFNSSGGMAASLGFPFTNAQWKELERQAIIYKYMMASIPVPPCLLTPTTKYLSSGPAATYPANLLGSALNLRFTNGADLEPGRCRRTDGKKWRCSRDVAPDQKYCERHMNRGRPRSRKPVEVHANNKKPRHSHASSSEAPVGTTTLCNPLVNRNSTASLFAGAISRPYLQAPSLPDTSCYKVATLDSSGAFVSTYKDPRHSDWMVKGEPVALAPTNQQWHRLVETEIGLATDSSFGDASVLSQHYQEEPLSLNSLGNFNTGEDQPSNNCSLFLEQNPKGFIDAWSAAGAASKEHSFSSNEKTCPSSLTLSMGATTSMDDDNETGQIQMGLGLIKSDQTHECGGGNINPGGPLAEALQLTTFSTTDSPSCGSSPCTTNVSSPSGSLQKPLASFSDNSGNSSSPALASSRAKSEMPLIWLSSG